MVSPIWRTENAATRSLKNLATFFNYQKSLAEENVMLKEKLSSLELEIMALSRERAEENYLLTLVGRRQETNIIAAAVLTHPPQTPYDTIIIDAGSNESISLDSRVFLPEGPGLGQVSEVWPNRARVKLFTAPGEKINAVLERHGVPVTLEGSGGGNFKMFLPRDVAVEEGDRILSADIVPNLLAIVEEVNIGPTDSFKEVLAYSPANIFAIRFVFVMP